jgi:hypothetical protein
MRPYNLLIVLVQIANKIGNFKKFLIISFLHLLNYLVATATKYGLDGPGSIPDNANLFSTSSRPVLGSKQRHIQGVAEVKRPGREADHSFPSSSEVKNGGIIPPLHGMVLK